jgi:ABC-type multidrug transport system fused ATPase/permease subunit
MQELRNSEDVLNLEKVELLRNTSRFSGNAEIVNLSFKYAGSDHNVLTDISLRIQEGEILAIAGPSGAGKSTLVDLLLGLYEPNEGSITLSGIEPKYAIKAWPGSVSYVPQSVTLINGSIAENVALGYSPDELNKAKVLQCLQTAQLDEYISTLPNGIDTIVGEAASRMSGGQLQRLGIARAIYTDPKLLVLDEATSALDGKTESEVSEAIIALKGKITVVLIAHRLSTVLKADRLAYLESGRLLSVGTFEHVKSQIPEFAHQASLSGL